MSSRGRCDRSCHQADEPAADDALGDQQTKQLLSQLRATLPNIQQWQSFRPDRADVRGSQGRVFGQCGPLRTPGALTLQINWKG